jgi:hypothetical protein
VLDGVLHGFPELELDLVETANVLPLDGRYLDDGLAERGGVGCAERKAEVFHSDTERIENLGIDCVLVEVDEVHLLTNLLHRSLGAK